MKTILLFAVILFSTAGYTQNAKMIELLTREISHKDEYARKKEEVINLLKNSRHNTLKDIYDNNQNIYKLYKNYQIDSAVAYVEKNELIAAKLKNSDLIVESNLQHAHLLSTAGKYKESEELLKAVKPKNLSVTLKALYYGTYSRFYEHYTANNYSKRNQNLIEKYRDSLLMNLQESSNSYKINLSQKYIFQKDFSKAENMLLKLVSSLKQDEADYAMCTYLLGQVYGIKAKSEKQIEYFLISALADTRNAIKDNASFQDLALIFYRMQDLDNAYLFTKSAVDDAIFCNVKFRTLNMSEMYSIINKAYVEKEIKSKKLLMRLSIFIGILSLILALLIFFIYRQMKKVTRIKEQLTEASDNLTISNFEITRTNGQLQELNDKLFESNRIKEEYIAYFFDTCSSYINKLELYRKSLNKKVRKNQLEDLFQTLNSNTYIDQELAEFYRNFDQIFLNLYPTFVTEFNSLLIIGEQVVLKQGELLNTELRIFALIRLGIKDSVKIAAFLRYSLNTIYAYRTKTRNKSAIDRDQFENMVMCIGEISHNQS
ncbi:MULTISPECIES: DUF6377 domain-containing protein [Flavobacterium]|uniref:DUF6377 domain-containing protein n=1 Tax=Flavobacterium TaxID=237 RepID=UPI001183B48E|nr:MULTISPECIES: DUF6377 domain-containing protein [Flavobacterium]MCR4030706.1 DUF6377 domain-containing protein [Flavobacterium panacis]